MTVIDITKPLQRVKERDEFAALLSGLEQKLANADPQDDALAALIAKERFRLQLVTIIVDAGYHPKDFLLVPKAR